MGDLSSIEWTRGVWQYRPGDAYLAEPETRLCHPLSDPGCVGAAQWVQGTSQWHGVLHYRPRGPMEPGTTIHLRATVKLSQAVARKVGLATNIHYLVTLDDVEEGLTLEEMTSGLLSFVNSFTVYLGDAPLPRFGSGWAYGDLHYHSQGTDNEGESAYNYRGVLEAMGAIGLSFVFATEHASASEQIVDADSHLIPPGVSASYCGLRDMSLERFMSLHASLNGSGGANRDVMFRASGRLPRSYLSAGMVPQVFLGGEVDVAPELGVDELIEPSPGEIETYTDPIDHQLKTRAKGFSFAFGDGLRYSLPNLCGGQQGWPFGSTCNITDLLDPFDGTYLLNDNQGINEFFHARQHLLYLPGDGADARAFVASFTEEYGGGSRLLLRSRNGVPGVGTEIADKGGAFFIAHPLVSIEPGGSRTWTIDLEFADSFLGPIIQLGAIADSEDACEESNEDNNASARITVDFPDVC